MVSLNAMLLDKFCFSERLGRKPLTSSRNAESAITLKEVKSIAFHSVYQDVDLRQY